MTGRRQRALHERLERGPLRVAIVAETFLPAVNGVTNSVLRVIEYLRDHGHDVLVIAPGPGDSEVNGVPVVRVKSFDLPRYEDLRIGSPRFRFGSIFREFRPDVIHLAAPTILGAAAVRSARRLGVPCVAIFQTDLAGFAKRHGLGKMADGIWNYLRWVHAQADRTLAPSLPSVWALRARGIPSVKLWVRGVDLERFNPGHRSEELRRFLAPNGEVIVGYVGRLAKEKQVERLAEVADWPRTRLVIVGDGPEREALEALMRAARFLGFQSGAELSKLHASFDIFAHTGIDETFCQSLQESMASGVPSVAPSVGGPLDLVKQGSTGFLWSPESPETLFGAIAELAADSDLRARLGRNGRAESELRPWSRIMDELVVHYRDVVRQRMLVEGRAA